MTVESILNRIFIRRDIVNCDRDVYLRKWYVIRWKHFAVAIHKFERSDEDRALHDHPWNFLVIPIWRGYWEQSELNEVMTIPNRGVVTLKIWRRVLPIISTRFRRGTYRHRVQLIGKTSHNSIAQLQSEAEYSELPSWSIFIRFTEWREWGFWTNEGFVESNKWWRQNCE